MSTKSSSHNKRVTSEKPVSLYPLGFKGAIDALLKVKPKPKDDKTEGVQKKEKPGD
jgi:hypothetical protein